MAKTGLQRSFSFLNAVQFLDALNENLFRLVLAYFLIAVQGLEATGFIMTATGGVFILPYLLFSSLGGVFADRWSKTSVIRYTRMLESLMLVLALLCIYYKAVLLSYFVLFFFASFSAIFSPSKYGAIPEVVTPKQLLRANSFIATFTYLGIILGTVLSSFLDDVTHGAFPLMVGVCLGVALIGTFASFGIEHLPAAHPEKRWQLFVYKELYTSLLEMYRKRYLLPAVFAYCYFMFIGTFVQLNIIPFTVEVLKMSPVMGGYLFFVSSAGLVVGSYLTSKITGSLTLVPLSGIMISVFMYLLTVFPSPVWLSVIWLFMLGFFAGLFLVPPQAFILSRSAPKDRGRNFSTANFFSFVFALLAAFTLYVLNTLLRLSHSASFAIVAVINLIVCLALFPFMKNTHRTALS